jgi:GNAT superfamily N-acetyltransferase
MWRDIGGRSKRELDGADPVYRRWAMQRLKTGSLVGFIIESPPGAAVASGCVWVMQSQPRPGWAGTRQAYLLSLFTEPHHRGKGYATRITRAAVEWARAKGIERMTLHASDQGRNVYTRLGFERTHEMRKVLRKGPTAVKARR